MVALIEVTITSLMKSPLIEVIVTSPINEQMVGAINDFFFFFMFLNYVSWHRLECEEDEHHTDEKKEKSLFSERYRIYIWQANVE